MLNELLDLFAGLYNTTINNSEMLSLVGLETRGKSKYKELSGGQKFVLVTFTTDHANEREIIPTVARVVLDGIKHVR